MGSVLPYTKTVLVRIVLDILVMHYLSDSYGAFHVVMDCRQLLGGCKYESYSSADTFGGRFHK